MHFPNTYIGFHLLIFVTVNIFSKLTNNFLISSWVINVIIPSRHWILNMLSYGDHSVLCFVHEMVLVHARGTVGILLGHLHAVVLHGVHGFHSVLLLTF